MRVVATPTGSEGKFGFVEFRTIAEATSCMALNNIELGGKQLRVERPRDYAPMPESMHDEVRAPRFPSSIFSKRSDNSAPAHSAAASVAPLDVCICAFIWARR